MMRAPRSADRKRSLRRRLMLLVSMAALLTWALAAALSYRQARHEVRELMDGQMEQAAAFLLAQVAHAPYDFASLAADMALEQATRNRYTRFRLEFTVLGPGGTLVARSQSGPALTLRDPPGIADITLAGEHWRSLLLMTPNGEYRVRVAQSLQEFDYEALEIAAKTVLPFLLFMPVLLGLIYFSVRRGLKPLDDLADEVSMRSPENLGALSDARAPREARPLVVALNRLLLRLDTTIENERRFTADAAHELRTPLAAIRIQAQVALANGDPDERHHALQQVVSGADRATRLVEGLLRLARLDPLASLPSTHRVDLVRLAESVFEQVHEVSPRAADLSLELAEQEIAVEGDADLLTVALRNLIDNALRYTEAGVPITVSARLEHGEPVLAVRDAGPGVPAAELPKLIERFYRGSDTKAEGSGLGLAIVRRIAELHGARLEVENLAEGGFLARLRWPGDR